MRVSRWVAAGCIDAGSTVHRYFRDGSRLEPLVWASGGLLLTLRLVAVCNVLDHASGGWSLCRRGGFLLLWVAFVR